MRGIEPEPQALAHGQRLWDYANTRQEPAPADVMIVMGTDDLIVPETAAALCKRMDFGSVITSGGVSHALSAEGAAFGGTEARVFAQTMIALGCPAETILTEDHARNTGQNVTLSRQVLQAAGIVPQTGLLVHVPGMQRRALATAERQWPEVAWRVTGPMIHFAAFLQRRDKTRVLRQLTGDCYRILLYPRYGFQTVHPMDPAVEDSLRALIGLGYLTLPPPPDEHRVLPGTPY